MNAKIKVSQSVAILMAGESHHQASILAESKSLRVFCSQRCGMPRRSVVPLIGARVQDCEPARSRSTISQRDSNHCKAAILGSRIPLTRLGRTGSSFSGVAACPICGESIYRTSGREMDRLHPYIACVTVDDGTQAAVLRSYVMACERTKAWPADEDRRRLGATA